MAARFFAFLRAINVGGRVAKMEQLRAAFAELGLAKVETFIASGNVIFETRALPTAESRIEKQLQRILGYEVKTFVRSQSELVAIANYRPFAAQEIDSSKATLLVAFLNALPGEEAQEKLLNADSAIDQFRFHGRELYWLCRSRLSESVYSGPRLEKTLGMRTTVRNTNTIRRLLAKYDVA